MYSNISNDAKNTLKSNVVTLTAKIVVNPNSQIIDGEYLQNITITDQCYDNGVIVGTAMCKEVEIELIDNNFDLADKDFSLEIGVLLPNNTYEYIPFGNFTVKEYKKIVSSSHYKLIAYDYMDKLNETFVDTNTYSTPLTLQEFYRSVANYYGLSIKQQENLPNSDFVINKKPYFDNMSGRTVLSRIAEMMGCFAKINRENKIEMKLKNTTSEQFSRAEMNNSLEIDNKFGPINVISLRLSQIEGENVTKRDEASIAQYGETTLQISDNPFVYTEALRLQAIDDIYDQVDGFSYYPTTFNGKLIYLDTGDEVEVQDMNTDNYYKTIILKQILKIPSTRNSIFENKALTDTGLLYQYTPEQVRTDRRTEYLVNKLEGTITQVVENVSEQNTKISQVQQTVNELNSKIQDVADVTTQQETIYANLNFTGINQSEPIEVKIKPTTSSISYLYPKNDLYPSDILYMPNRVLRFTNTSIYVETEDEYYLDNKKYYSYDEDIYILLIAGTDYIIGNPIFGTIYQNQYVDYELPDDLLLESNSGTCDEFYLGYDEQICQVTKRCKYNADGTVALLDNEIINSYTYPSIPLADGDYTIELLGYNNAYMGIRLMVQNIYTSQFATKAELSSSITQTAREINLRVDEKLDEEDFTSANILLKINNDESQATINADKINLNGTVTANNYFKIKTDGSMEAVNGTFKNGKIEIIGSYTADDLITVKSNSDNTSKSYLQAGGLGIVGSNSSYRVDIQAERYNFDVSSVDVIDHNGNTYIQGAGIRTPSITQTSREEDKKNFEKLQNGLDIVKATDIYKYNLKNQKNNEKKHIGFVIGNNYKYSQEITSQNNDGVDTYSMISVAYKAIQEQQEQIEQLQKEIKELKGEK